MKARCIETAYDDDGNTLFLQNAKYELESCQHELIAVDEMGDKNVIVGPMCDWTWFQKHFIFVQEKPQGYVDVDLLSDQTREQIMERLDIDDPEKFPKDMTPFQAFDHWLQYEGIIGYTGLIIDVINDINEAASEGCGREVFS